MKRKIIITGGCGFIGSNLAQYLLKKKYEIIIIDDMSVGSAKNIIHFRKKVKLIKINVNKINKIKKINGNIFALIHLAAKAEILISKENENKYYDDNVNSVMQVLNFSQRNKIKRIIFASSASIYGDTKNFKVNENFKLKPGHFYAFTKYIGEKMIRSYCNINSIKYTIMRFFNIYGPGSTAVIGRFIAQKIQKKKLTIYGNGNQKRDFLYVEDLCEAIHLSLKKKISENKIYNLGSGKAKSINEIKNIISKKNFVNLVKRNDDIEVSISDNKRIKKELKWKNKTNLEKGINSIFISDFDNLKKLKFKSISQQEKIIKKFNLKK